MLSRLVFITLSPGTNWGNALRSMLHDFGCPVSRKRGDGDAVFDAEYLGLRGVHGAAGVDERLRLGDDHISAGSPMSRMILWTSRAPPVRPGFSTTNCPSDEVRGDLFGDEPVAVAGTTTIRMSLPSIASAGSSGDDIEFGESAGNLVAVGDDLDSSRSPGLLGAFRGCDCRARHRIPSATGARP